METKIRDDVCWIIGFVKGSFPGTNPVSITNHNLQFLNQNDYYVSSKTDGERKLIYCHKCETYLIDRKFRVNKIKNTIISTWGKTLLDAEEIEEDGKIIYLVFDAVMVNDWYTGNDNLNSRLYWANTILPQNSDQIFLKKMYSLKETFSVYHKKQNHKTDGLIFTNIYAPYRGGRCESLLKYKELSQNTIDFKAIVKEKVELYIGVLGQPTKFVGHLDMDAETFLQQYSCGDIIECQFLSDTLYKPLKKRSDKELPNDIKVYKSVLQSIKEGITMNDVLRQCNKPKRDYPIPSKPIQMEYDPLGSLFPDE